MDNYKSLRIVGHLSLLSMMFVAFYKSNKLVQEHLPHIPQLPTMVKMQPRFVTMWAVIGQIIYALLALLCDVSEVLKLGLPKWLTNFRHTWFAGVVVPATMIPNVTRDVYCLAWSGHGLDGTLSCWSRYLIAKSVRQRICLFWPIYLYDKALVIPDSLQVMLPPYINFCFHGLVYFYMFWEFLFLPEDAPMKNNLSFTMMCTAHVTYTCLLFYTRYGDFGIWPYDILKKIEDSILLYGLIGLVTYITFASYYFQWPLKEALWKRREKSKIV